MLRAIVVTLAVIASSASAQSRITARVSFDPGSAKLSAVNDSALAMAHDFLVTKETITLLRIEANSDGAGTVAQNQLLSEQRAMAVARWLVTSGISCKRLVPVGFGNTKPVAAAEAADHLVQNNRVEFVNAALRDHLIGGMPADGGGKVAGDPC